jgi:hypothetical protein
MTWSITCSTWRRLWFATRKTINPRFRGVGHRRLNVCALKVISSRNLVWRFAGRQIVEDYRHHDPGALNARFTVTNNRVRSDSILPVHEDTFMTRSFAGFTQL